MLIETETANACTPIQWNETEIPWLPLHQHPRLQNLHLNFYGAVFPASTRDLRNIERTRIRVCINTYPNVIYTIRQATCIVLLYRIFYYLSVSLFLSSISLVPLIYLITLSRRRGKQQEILMDNSNQGPFMPINFHFILIPL